MFPDDASGKCENIPNMYTWLVADWTQCWHTYQVSEWGEIGSDLSKLELDAITYLTDDNYI